MQDMRKIMRTIIVMLMFFSMVSSIFFYLGTWKTDASASDGGDVLSDESAYAEDEDYRLVSYTTFTYDQFGNQRSCYEYNADGTLASFEEKRYATTGDWLQRVSGSQYGSHRTQTDRRLYGNDVEGETRIVKAEYYDEGILQNVTYNYFFDGKVAKLTAWLSETGEVESYHGRIYMDTEEEETLARFTYESDKTLTNFLYSRLDDKNRLLEEYKGTGTDDTVFSEQTLATYDDREHSSRQITYWPIGHLNSYQDESYSADGKLLKRKMYLHGLNGGTLEDPMADMRIAEGYWAEYDGERVTWELRTSWKELQGYTLYRYDTDGLVSLKFEYQEGDATTRRLNRYVYDEERRVKEIYTYALGEELEEFTFTDNGGIRYVVHFDAVYRTIKTITSHYPEGNIKEQYSFLKRDWVHDNQMLWHDVYYYKYSPENKNKAYETAVYRYDIEENLLEVLDGSAL